MRQVLHRNRFTAGGTRREIARGSTYCASFSEKVLWTVVGRSRQCCSERSCFLAPTAAVGCLSRRHCPGEAVMRPSPAAVGSSLAEPVNGWGPTAIDDTSSLGWMRYWRVAIRERGRGLEAAAAGVGEGVDHLAQVAGGGSRVWRPSRAGWSRIAGWGRRSRCA